MKKILYLFILTSFFGFSQQKVDIVNSSIKWTGKQISGKSHFGTLSFKSGNLSVGITESIQGQFVVDMTSMSVEDLSGKGKKSLEGHLISDDFFSVNKYNQATLTIVDSKIEIGSKLVGVKIQTTGTETEIGSDEILTHYIINGNLTIKGITNPVTFEMMLCKENTYCASLTFDRSKYDIRYGSGSFFENLGDRLILDEIELEVKLVII